MAAPIPPYPLLPTLDGSVVSYEMVPDGSLIVMTTPEFDTEILKMMAGPGEISVTPATEPQWQESPYVVYHVQYHGPTERAA